MSTSNRDIVAEVDKQLEELRQGVGKNKKSAPKAAAGKLEKDRLRKVEERAKDRDIEYSPISQYRYKKRIEREKDFETWAKYYFPKWFDMEFSSFHKVGARKLRVAVEQGGYQALAWPRGSGKSTICRGALLWALLTGKKRYGLLIGATSKKADAELAIIKRELRFNEKLKADYPEVIEVIAALDDSPKKAATQTAYGEPTLIEWLKKSLVLPSTKIRIEQNGKITEKPSPSSGSALDALGITGDIRGCIRSTSAGQIRPDIAICDDPQTNESAKSLDQTNTRLRLIKADVVGCAGPTVPFTLFVPCTVIYKGDLADKLLDREANPDFRGERYGILDKLPQNKSLWNKYNKVRIEGLELEDDGEVAAEFYKKHRKQLDRGCSCTWPERYKYNEVSGIQGAMNKFYEMGELAFFSELMNQPMQENISALDVNIPVLKKKLNNVPKGEVPKDVRFLTVGVDINTSTGLHWVVGGYTNDLTGYVIDYGKYPSGNEKLYDPETSTETESQALYNALYDLVSYLEEAAYQQGPDLKKIDMMSIDVGYEGNTVFQFMRGHKSSIPLIGSRGMANSKYFVKKSNLVGKPFDNADVRAWEGKGNVLAHNACVWRKRMQQALLLLPRSPSSISLYGDEFSAVEYLAEHLVVEKLVDYAKTEKGEFYKWTKPPKAKNDLQDSLVMTLVAAHALGAEYRTQMRGSIKDEETEAKKEEKPKPKKKQVRKARKLNI